MQSRGFAVFCTLLLAPLLIPGVQPMFYGIRSLYESRERSSRIYSAWAWLTAMTICEIPYAILGSVFYFLPWYYMVGSNGGSSNAGRQYATVLLLEIFAPHFGMWIAAASPTLTIVNIVNPFMFGTALSVTGIVIPWSQLPSVYKDFVYFANPLTWAGKALQANALHGVQVTCTKDELVVFQPPQGETCMSYAGEWLRGTTGYISNPNATADCSYCQYANGDEYLNFLNVQ
jgi:ABC-type multidrug transport system permease subunit